MPTKVMSVDAQEVMRAGIQMICLHNDDLEYVGESFDFRAAYSVAHHVRPDVIVFDPRSDLAFAATFVSRIRSIVPAARLLAFTDGGVSMQRVIAELGDSVSGCVAREAGLSETLLAIRSVAQGKIFICHAPSPVPAPNGTGSVPNGAGSVRNGAESAPNRKPTTRRHGPTHEVRDSALTSPPLAKFPVPTQLVGREREVLVRMSQGKTNQEVAKELFLSVHTISDYRSFLMRSNGLNDEADVIRFSRRVIGR